MPRFFLTRSGLCRTLRPAHTVPTMTDPHALLGVPRNATLDQIRAAYRRLARQTHPDVSAHPEATARFAAISDAYQRLLNAELGHIPPRTTAPPGSTVTPGPDAEEAGEIYDAFFSAAGRARSRPPRRRHPFEPLAGTLDLAIDMPLTAQEAASGTRVPVPTPAGPVELDIPAATPDGRSFRIVGHGARGRGAIRGDLIVRVRIVPGSGAGMPAE